MQKIPLTELKGESKMARLKVKPDPGRERLAKPKWIRINANSTGMVKKVKKQMRDLKLHTVCEEASCPNLGECFSKGTATFMIMGGICTRRCPFCDVAHGRPHALDADEPKNVAQSIKTLNLKYVVITSVDRDDLRDGGAAHFSECVREARAVNSQLKVEVLVPDFRGKVDTAMNNLATDLPDVLNHNMETVSRLYKSVRPGASYQGSLDLLQKYKQAHPQVTTKSGLMVGVGETREEVIELMQDLRDNQVDMLTIGQYLQPSKHHLAVERYVHPDEFAEYQQLGMQMGFTNVASGPMVRSSYHADIQAGTQSSSEVTDSHTADQLAVNAAI
jgi:lipoic acid synthetase